MSTQRIVMPLPELAIERPAMPLTSAVWVRGKAYWTVAALVRLLEDGLQRMTEADRQLLIKLGDDAYLAQKEVEDSATGKRWEDITRMDIDQPIIDAAEEYLSIIDRIGRGEMNLNYERTEAHDRFIFELQRIRVQGIGYDLDGRENARELAKKIVRWVH